MAISNKTFVGTKATVASAGTAVTPTTAPFDNTHTIIVYNGDGSNTIYLAFTDDAAIIAMAVSYIRTMVFAFPFITIGVISGRIFQGLGEGIPSLLLTAMRVVLVSGALAFLFVRVLSMGLESVWLALALGAAITSTISFVWLRWRLGYLERRQ